MKIKILVVPTKIERSNQTQIGQPPVETTTDPNETKPAKFVSEFNLSNCIIGRHDCELVLTDARCSAQHALLFESFSGELKLKDLNSTNGTYVNGQKVQECALQIGDAIRIGRTNLFVLDFQSATKAITEKSRVEVSEDGTENPFAPISSETIPVEKKVHELRKRRRR